MSTGTALEYVNEFNDRGLSMINGSTFLTGHWRI
jgi:hypothetical protein